MEVVSLSKQWRILDKNPLSAADHMAMDEVLLASRSEGKSPDTLRFLQFSPRCALVGLHQAVELEIEEDYCRTEGIEINRRITGGGAIFWGPAELGWEIYAGKEWLKGYNLDAAYRLLCEVMVKALQEIGVKAAFRPRNDIEVGNRKICGTGGAELGNAFVFQCSLLVDFDVDSMVKVLKVPKEKISDKSINTVGERVTWLKRELNFVPDHARIKEAICRGFESVFGIDLRQEELNSWEEALFAEKKIYFRSRDWINKVRLPVEAGEVTGASRKTPGGLIRIAAKVDRHARIIKSVLLTGDFFAYPPSVIYKLEACLKDCPLDGHKMTDIIEGFFIAHPGQIAGVNAQDVELCLKAALA